MVILPCPGLVRAQLTPPGETAHPSEGLVRVNVSLNGLRTSQNAVKKLSEKSLRCPKRVPTRLPNRPVRPFRLRYTGQMHARSVTRTPFQTVSSGSPTSEDCPSTRL